MKQKKFELNLIQRKNDLLNALTKKGLWLSVLVGLLPAIIISYLAYTSILDGIYQGLDKRRVQVEQKEVEVRRGLAVEAQEPSFNQEFARIIQLFRDSQPMIPPGMKTSEILGYLQNLGSRHNVKVTSMVAVSLPIKSANAEKLYERELPVSVVGNYDDVLRFWMELSKLERILVVRDFTVQSAKPTDGKTARPSFVTANFMLLAFHAPPTSEFPSDLPDVLKSQTIAQLGVKQ